MNLRVRWYIFLLLLLPLAFGLSRLRLDVEVLNLLPRDLPVVRGLELYQEKFSNAQELILTVHASEAEQAETAARLLTERLRAQTNLVEEVHWQPPWNERPREYAELVAALWLNQPPEMFAQLAQRFEPGPLSNALRQTREMMALSLSPAEVGQRGYDPLDLLSLPPSAQASATVLGSEPELFASSDGRFRLVFVEARPPLVNYQDCQSWLEAIRAQFDLLRQSPDWPAGMEVGLTGRPAFVAEIAGGMEEDMFGSAGGTMLVIGALFWWAHRRFRPLLWLLALLAVVLAMTLAAGGLIYGTLNVVSLGFAAILLGLGVDYALVLYEESQAAPGTPLRELRREISPSIYWSALTSAGAFLVLNWSRLPGLQQLGTLVALGIGLAAWVMVTFWLPPLHGRGTPAKQPEALPTKGSPHSGAWLAWSATGVLLLIAAVVLGQGLPALDRTTTSLRPRNSPAYAALDQIHFHLESARDPLWLIVSGTNELEVARRLEAVEAQLEQAVSNGVVRQFTLPSVLWPRPDLQQVNRTTAAKIVSRREAFGAAAREHGFAPDALELTGQMLDSWQEAAQAGQVYWPDNVASRWVLDRVASRGPAEFYALGYVYPVGDPARVLDFFKMHADPHLLLTGWEVLGSSTFKQVQTSMWQILIPMGVVVLVSLWLAFRRVGEVALTMGMLLFNLLCLLTIMRLAGWSWNLLNLMAVPLLLGVADDYSIHMQLALRRHGGDIRQTRRIIGRALLLCGGTTITGFGSLAFSSNAGLASLGQICAAGIACCVFSGVFLLPYWWQRLAGPHSARAVSSPSTLYGPRLWRLSLQLARRLPVGVSMTLARGLAGVYWRVNRTRREIIVQNLQPITGERAQARRCGRQLLGNFSQKLVDLWRYESGWEVGKLFTELTGWEHFVTAEAQGRGVLLLTPHLGNWEFGGPLLTGRGYKLQVITLREPGAGLTEMRLASRARHGIETLVIGDDPFGFVEIIKRLQSGATVALLMDRPPPPSAVRVELFGRPFDASIAAAELARASGCVLLPAILPRTPDGYAAHILPEVKYDRRALSDRAARQQLTQEIMRAFEPAIRKYLNQWYHFVPIWPKE